MMDLKINMNFDIKPEFLINVFLYYFLKIIIIIIFI